MNIAWIGFHREGIPALEAVLEQGREVVRVITLPGDLAARRSGAGDYQSLCRRHRVPLSFVRHINDPESVDLLKSLHLDLAVVLGWSQILGADALATARLGVIGAHASLLPKNRGSAPVNWAIINGERRTGNSLMWLTPEVDQGQVIDQREFAITEFDTCATLYDRVAETNREMILALLPKLDRGQRPGRPQTELDTPLLPRRRPKDGLIRWDQPSARVYDFVRALTHPYPGAFGYLGERKWKVWKAALVPLNAENHIPGEVIGPVSSPESSACGQLVACADGAILLLEVEDATGKVVRGPALCQQPWEGKVFSHAA